MSTPRNPSTAQPFVEHDTGIIKTEWLRFLMQLANGGPYFDLRTGPPSNPSESDTYYDTVLHKARTWDGTTWRNWW